MYALIQKDIKPLQDKTTNLKNQKEVEKQKLITDLVYEYNKWKKLDEEWKKLDVEIWEILAQIMSK